MKIETTYWRKPIPTNRADWSAWDDDYVDGAEDAAPICKIVGYGATEREAINDFVEKRIEHALSEQAKCFERHAKNPEDDAHG